MDLLNKRIDSYLDTIVGKFISLTEIDYFIPDGYAKKISLVSDNKLLEMHKANSSKFSLKYKNGNKFCIRKYYSLYKNKIYTDIKLYYIGGSSFIACGGIPSKYKIIEGNIEDLVNSLFSFYSDIIDNLTNVPYDFNDTITNNDILSISSKNENKSIFYDVYNNKYIFRKGQFNGYSSLVSNNRRLVVKNRENSRLLDILGCFVFWQDLDGKIICPDLQEKSMKQDEFIRLIVVRFVEYELSMFNRSKNLDLAIVNNDSDNKLLRLSNGAIIKYGKNKSILHTDIKYFYSAHNNGNKLNLLLYSIINYLSYLEVIQRASLLGNINKYFNYCLKSTKRISKDVKFIWVDSVYFEKALCWKLKIHFPTSNKTFLFSVVYDYSETKLPFKAFIGNTFVTADKNSKLYKNAYECIDNFCKIYTVQLKEVLNYDNTVLQISYNGNSDFPEKFNITYDTLINKLNTSGIAVSKSEFWCNRIKENLGYFLGLIYTKEYTFHIVYSNLYSKVKISCYINDMYISKVELGKSLSKDKFTSSILDSINLFISKLEKNRLNRNKYNS